MPTTPAGLTPVGYRCACSVVRVSRKGRAGVNNTIRANNCTNTRVSCAICQVCMVITAFPIYGARCDCRFTFCFDLWLLAVLAGLDNLDITFDVTTFIVKP